jgi:erythromycin esterase-like protein
VRRSYCSTALCLLSVIAGGARPSRAQTAIHLLDANDLGSVGQWRFLPLSLRNVDVVSLPEPIHLTHEFPIVRLGIVKFLNEHLGFHVLAMEGSLVDAWAAQDRFLASARTPRDAADAQLALFPLWNTPELLQLFEYEAASWSTPTPLYVTAYDVQPGTGKGTPGSEAFRLLAERLETYSPPPAGLVVENWLRDLRPLTGGCKTFTPEDVPSIEHAIEQLDAWVAMTTPTARTRFPWVAMHAGSLRLLPANVRGSLKLCRGVASGHSGTYKTLRDREGAEFAEALLGASTDRKLVLWAHWSHLTYADSGTGASVGGGLRRTLGNRLYTILPVAERGSAIVIFPSRSSDDDIGFSWARPSSDGFSKRMRAMSTTSFFLDLRDPAIQNDTAFTGTVPIWIESRRIDVPLTESTDAVIWLKHVRPPRLPLVLLVILGGMHYRTMLLALSCGAVGIVVLAVRRLRRQRLPPRRRPQRRVQ